MRAVINAECQCGKTLKAQAAYGGKRVKCPGCGNPVRLPEWAENDQRGAIDEWHELIDEAVAVSKQPKEQPLPKEPAEKKRKRRRSKSGLDGKSLILGGACIAQGILGPGIAFRVVWMVAKTAGASGLSAMLMSLPGFAFLGTALLAIGFIACGVGILLQQNWAAPSAQLISYPFIAIVLLSTLWPVAYVMVSSGANIEILLFAGLKRAVPQLIVPSYLIWAWKPD